MYVWVEGVGGCLSFLSFFLCVCVGFFFLFLFFFEGGRVEGRVLQSLHNGNIR